MKRKQENLLLLMSLLFSLAACVAFDPELTLSNEQVIAVQPSPTAVPTEVVEPTPTPEPEVQIVLLPFVDRRSTLSQIVEQSILPLHQAVVVETELLQAAAHQFQTEASTKNLETLQTQWQATALAWARAEHLGFRFTMIIHNQIKKWPINKKFIEKFITEETQVLDEPFIESIGSTSKGITAIEYLIFNPDLSQEEIAETLANNPRRMAYMVASTENLHQKSQELLQLWSPEGDNQAQAFIEADFSDDNLQGSISMLANEMIVQIEELTNTRLNYPRKGVYGDPQPDSVESPYARYSIPLMAENLRGLQQTFDAGLGSYLDFLQADEQGALLSERAGEQFVAAIAAVEAISPSLHDGVSNDPDTVDQAFDELKALLVLFKVDMAGQMGITVTFSDNDGD